MSSATEYSLDRSQELAELEAALRNVNYSPREESEEHRWRRVIDTSNDAFICTDAAGTISEWNVKAENLFGWTAEEAIGQKLRETVFPPRDGEDTNGGLQILFQLQDKGKRLELLARRSDGSDVPVEVSISPMRHGSSFVFNMFVHDVTQRHHLQVKLAHAQKLESIGQLSAGIAHEINTPTQYVGDNTRFVQETLSEVLDVIEAYGKLTEAVRTGGETQAALEQVDRVIEEVDLNYILQEILDAVDQTLEGVDRVASIVRAMKEFSHPGSAAKTPTDINKAINNTITVATNEWKYVAKVDTDFCSTLPLVPCLPGDFNQVILNLIVNGAHAIGDCIDRQPDGKGTISVSTKSVGPFVEVRISDTGTGIPEHIVNKIFDPFFTTKDVGVGTGQGLAIARSVIVDKHGGTVEVESVEGQGSTFVIRLPLQAAEK